MWHCCMQYPNEMNKQSFPYAQLKLMQHIYYKNSVDIEKRHCVKAFYSLNGKRKHNWKKYMTYNCWNRGGGFKQLFYSCAVVWNGQLVYEATRCLHSIIWYAVDMGDSLCKISDLTQEFKFRFQDQAVWAGKESFVTNCGKKNPT